MVNRIQRFWRYHRTSACIALLLLLFPLGVGALYALPLPQIIAIDSGELLNYYAIAFGLFGSAFAYLENKKKNELAKEKESVPHLAVKLIKSGEIFLIEMKNAGTTAINDIYLYDQRLKLSLRAGETYTEKLIFSKRTDGGDVVCIWGYDDFDVDEFGYPDYVQIGVSDSLDRGWSLTYTRMTVSESPLFSLSSASCESF